jgi:hypothetical protein
MFLKIGKQILIFSVFWIVASATFSGFSIKWGLRDNDPRLSVAKMLNGTAYKPYVYRQLIPAAANMMGDNISDELINKLGQRYYTGTLKDYSVVSNPPDSPAKYKFKWLVVYWLSFMMLLGSLYLLSGILYNSGVGLVTAISAPCIFSLCMPIIQTVGGYFYDYSELFFMSLAVYLVQKNRPILLLIRSHFYFFYPLFTHFYLKKMV